MKTQIVIAVLLMLFFVSYAAAQEPDGSIPVVVAIQGKYLRGILSPSGDTYSVSAINGVKLQLNIDNEKENSVAIGGLNSDRPLVTITASSVERISTGHRKVTFVVQQPSGSPETVQVTIPENQIVTVNAKSASFNAEWLSIELENSPETAYVNLYDDVEISLISISKKIVQDAYSAAVSSGAVAKANAIEKVTSLVASSYNVADLCDFRSFIEVSSPSKMYVLVPESPYLFNEDAGLSQGKNIALAVTEDGYIKYVVFIKRPVGYELHGLLSITRIVVMRPTTKLRVDDYKDFYNSQQDSKTLFNLISDSTKMVELKGRSLTWGEFKASFLGGAGGAAAGAAIVYGGGASSWPLIGSAVAYLPETALGVVGALPVVGEFLAGGGVVAGGILTAAIAVVGGTIAGVTVDLTHMETYAYDGDNLLVTWDKETFSPNEAKIDTLIVRNRNCKYEQEAAQTYTKGCVEIPITGKMKDDLLSYSANFSLDYVAGHSKIVIDGATQLNATIKDGKLIVDGVEEGKNYKWHVDDEKVGYTVGYIQTESTDIETGQIKPSGECGK